MNLKSSKKRLLFLHDEKALKFHTLNFFLWFYCKNLYWFEKKVFWKSFYLYLDCANKIHSFLKHSKGKRLSISFIILNLAILSCLYEPNIWTKRLTKIEQIIPIIFIALYFFLGLCSIYNLISTWIFLLNISV